MASCDASPMVSGIVNGYITEDCADAGRISFEWKIMETIC